MDDFKRPEGNVTPEGEPGVGRTTSLDTSEKNSRVGRWLLWGVVVLLVAGLGALAYWQYTEAQNARTESESLKSALTTAKKSSKDATAADTPAADATTEQSDDTTAQVNRITAVVTADAQAPVASKGEKLDVMVLKQSAEFAYANAGSPEGAGYAVILKKVNDEWVIVFKGQNTPDKTVVDMYGIPADFQSGQ